MNDRYSRQRGFGLVEILISLVVGLMLTAGLIQIFAANKQTYRTIDASSGIQENARFAMEILGRHLRLAGYRADPTVDFATAFAPVTYAGYSLGAGQVIAGNDNEVVIRYQGDGTMKDCAGSNIASGASVSTRFYLDSGDLKCSTDSGTQPLISDVQQMTIRYGVDTDGDDTANRYDRAAGVTDWGQVVSVRISLVFRSSEDNVTTTPQPYTLNGIEITPGDRRLRRVFTTTIALRNLLP